MQPRNNILMRKRVVPKRVQLPDCRVFMQNTLTYKKWQGSRRRQQGCGIKSALKKANTFRKKR